VEGNKLPDNSPRYFLGYTDEADWPIFCEGKQTTFGFTEARRSRADTLRHGDILLCYVRITTRCGLLATKRPYPNPRAALTRIVGRGSDVTSPSPK
jgi:hypothetical protein